MPAKVGYLVIDTADPATLARFWCGLLAVTVDTEIGEEFLVLSPTEDGLTIGFQRVADPRLGKNRVHLDLVVDDLQQATEEISSSVAAGSNRGTPANSKASSGAAWLTLRATSSTSTCSRPPSRRLLGLEHPGPGPGLSFGR